MHAFYVHGSDEQMFGGDEQVLKLAASAAAPTAATNPALIKIFFICLSISRA
jgi:hypothetical protein